MESHAEGAMKHVELPPNPSHCTGRLTPPLKGKNSRDKGPIDVRAASRSRVLPKHSLTSQG
jgi:hypothetical protein